MTLSLKCALFASGLLAVVRAYTDEEETQEISQAELAAPTIKAQRSYLIEALVVLCLFCYVLNFYLGCKKNQSIAVNWMHTLAPIFEANFCHVGVPDQGDGVPLLQ
jgi:hypothetical protein